MKRFLGALFVLLALAGVAHPFGLGLGNRLGKFGAVGQGGGGIAPPAAGLALTFLPANATTTPNVNAGSHAPLQWERTQPWTALAQINVATPPTSAAIIFTTCNQGNADTHFPGYEFWIDGTGKLRVRVISDIATNNYIGVIGTTNVATGATFTVAASYDGSSTVAGVKIYVNGVLETMTSEGFSLSGSIINAQPLVLGNQLGFAFSLGGTLANFSLSNVVRSQAQIAAYTTAAGAVDANTVLAYNFPEGFGVTTADLSTNGFTATDSAALWPPGRPNIYFTGALNSASALSTYGFTIQAGPADASRVLVAAVTSRIGANTTATANSVTIGGVAATLITDSRNTNAGALTTTSLWQAAVPTGTTAAVSAVFSNTMARASCSLYALYYSNGVVPSGGAVTNFSGTSAGAVATGTITVPSSGVALISGSLSSGTGIGLTPTNYQAYGGTPGAGPSTMWVAGGTDSTAGSRSYTMTWTGTSPSLPTGVFAAWAPGSGTGNDLLSQTGVPILAQTGSPILVQ